MLQKCTCACDRCTSRHIGPGATDAITYPGFAQCSAVERLRRRQWLELWRPLASRNHTASCTSIL